MTLKLYAHPLSSYCQKVLTALYENETAFEYRVLDGTEPVAGQFAALWPIGRFPLLTDGDRTVPEATMIIQYLDVRHPGPTRSFNLRHFRNGAGGATPRSLLRQLRPHPAQQRLVMLALGRDPAATRPTFRAQLETAYAWLDRPHLAGRTWAAGDAFSLADSGAAPALLYADWTHAIPRAHANLWAYRDRLLARPSYARALDEARPYRHMFPLGAPTDRD